MSQIPPVIAHRGAAALAPENTLAAFRRAAALGATWVELDCQLTSDKVPVVIHDLKLRRTSSGRGLICRRSAAQLRDLDAGSWFDPSFSAERIPTLAEALTEIARLGLGVNIEIKPSPGQAEETGRLAMRVASQVWPRRAPPPLVSSFARASLAAVQDERPDWPRGLLSVALPRDWRTALSDLGCVTINLHHLRLSAERVAMIRESGYAVLAFTVNEPERAQELWQWGVTSVFTDHPERLLPLI